MSIKILAKQYPIATYFGLAFAITWGSIVAVVAAKGFQSDALRMADVLLMFLAMLAGPSLAGLTLMAIVEGQAGLHALLSRMGRWRVKLRWYGVALFTIPLLLLALLYLLTIFVSSVYAPGVQIAGFAIGIAAGFFEELGWTGFALPRMRARLSPLAAGLLLGVIWAVWHAMADYWGNIGALGAWWLPHFILFWVVPLPAYRMIMVWVYEHTESLLLAQIMHAGYTGSLLILSPSTTHEDSLLWKAIFATTLWVIVGAIAVTHRESLMRCRLQTRPVSG